MVRVRTIAAALILTHIVCAQSNWRPMPDTQPAGRRAHAAAYDEARERLVLFGGLTPQVTFAQNDTWEWDGTRWHAMASPQSPSQRYSAAMTYDADRGRSVLFGGIESNTIKGDTWEWDGTQWSEVSATTAPPPRSSATLVYDSTRKRVVMYGGNLRFGSSSPLSDLWEFDGTDWVQRSFSNGPGPMSGHIAAYDEHRQRMVVYSSKDHELWEWDGTSWALADPNPAFPKRSGASLAYD